MKKRVIYLIVTTDMYWLSVLYKKIKLLKYNKIHDTFIKSLL